jgi:hypothetical protein
LSRIDGAARAAPIADASDDAILTDPNQRDLNDRNEIDASRSFRVRRPRCAVVVLAWRLGLEVKSAGKSRRAAPRRSARVRVQNRVFS